MATVMLSTCPRYVRCENDMAHAAPTQYATTRTSRPGARRPWAKMSARQSGKQSQPSIRAKMRPR